MASEFNPNNHIESHVDIQVAKPELGKQWTTLDEVKEHASIAFSLDIRAVIPWKYMDVLRYLLMKHYLTPVNMLDQRCNLAEAQETNILALSFLDAIIGIMPVEACMKVLQQIGDGSPMEEALGHYTFRENTVDEHEQVTTESNDQYSASLADAFIALMKKNGVFAGDELNTMGTGEIHKAELEQEEYEKEKELGWTQEQIDDYNKSVDEYRRLFPEDEEKQFQYDMDSEWETHPDALYQHTDDVTPEVIDYGFNDDMDDPF